MSNHTPGPWSVSINQAVSDSGSIKTLTGADHYSDPVGGEFFKPYVAVVGADGSVICDNAQYYAQDIDPKNVNLIAAAPDLLEALIRARDDLNNAAFLIRKELGEHHWLYGIEKGKKIADEAIARAKGESQ